MVPKIDKEILERAKDSCYMTLDSLYRTLGKNRYAVHMEAPKIMDVYKLINSIDEELAKHKKAPAKKPVADSQ